MKVQDIMTKDVVSVRPQTPVREIAILLAEKRISGVPVLTDDGAMVGIVTESDLLHRAELGTEKKRKWWLRVLSDSNQLARDFTQSHGQYARDVMARYVVTTRADADLAEVAEVMDSHRIKRLPVISDGKLVGVVTRGDLVKALARADVKRSSRKLDNSAVHSALHKRMQHQPWLNASLLSVSVQDGKVELAGFVESSEQAKALRVLAEETEGVTSVEDRLTVGLPRMLGGL